MPIPTDEQIKQWRARWDKYPGLADEIAAILKGDEPAQTEKEALKRMRIVNDHLKVREFNKYIGCEQAIILIDNEVLVPVLDLRGITWNNKILSEIIIPHAHFDGANLWKTQFKGAHLSNSHFIKTNCINTNFDDANCEMAEFQLAYCHSAYFVKTICIDTNFAHAVCEEAHFELADCMGANFENTNCSGAHFEKAECQGINFMQANCRRSHFEGADLTGANFEETDCFEANFKGANCTSMIIIGANCNGIYVGKFDHFDMLYLFDEDTDNREHLGEITIFSLNDFLPSWRNSFYIKHDWHRIGQYFLNRPFYTKFKGVNIDEANVALAPDLYRYVKDQQYLYRYKESHPIAYWIWKIYSDCGGSMLWVAWWSFWMIFGFAWLYSAAPLFTVPNWMVGSWTEWILMEPGQKLVDLGANKAVSEWMQWFYVSFDIFTNLGIRSTNPACNAGVVAVFLETVLGFVSLGMLISVLTNKYARRS